jgi:hypothetical protein
MNNVIELQSVLKEYELGFSCPRVFSMSTENQSRLVSLEIGEGEGTAVIRARSLKEARSILHKIIPVTGWLD